MHYVQSLLINPVLWTLIGIPLVSALLKYLIPRKRKRAFLIPNSDTERQLMLFDMHASSLFVLMSIVVYVPIWIFLIFLAQEFHQLEPKSEVVLFMPSPYWGLVALFWSILIGMVLGQRASRRELHNDYDALIEYEERKDGYDFQKTFLAISIFLIVVCVPATIQGFRYRIQLDGQELTIQRLLSFKPSVYAMSAIVQIITAPVVAARNGRTARKRVSTIRFDDGAHWSTDFWEGANDQAAERLIRIISARSGTPIREVPILGPDDL